jgi:DNA-directed RNA polymerase specialized sigma24 family protein
LSASDVTPEPDLLLEVLRRVRARVPGLDDALAEAIEAEVRRDLGGERTRIAKRGKHLTPEQRQALFDAGIQQKPEAEITGKFRISRATLYRQMKRGRP